MTQYATESVTKNDLVPYAWIEAIDEDHVFIGTADSIACFILRNLPPRWGERFKGAFWNLILAQTIDSYGSPGGTPFDRVSRLDWPLIGNSPGAGFRPFGFHTEALREPRSRWTSNGIQNPIQVAAE
jgi:hypothetical protein